jgi:hypothetical protein
MKKALITGITGQDGSYLAELLLSKGYEVHGLVRRVALEDPEHRLSRILPVMNQVKLHAASLESYASIHNVVDKVQPDECYHLAARCRSEDRADSTRPERSRQESRGSKICRATSVPSCRNGTACSGSAGGPISSWQAPGVSGGPSPWRLFGSR